MERNVAHLVDQIYNEGLEKARADADRIIANAKKEAAQILESARHEERQILEKAQQQAVILRENTIAELHQSSNQCLTELRSSIENLLEKNLLSNFSNATMLDENFVKDLILNLASNWKQAGDSNQQSLTVLLPEGMQTELQDRLAASLKHALPGINLKSDAGFGDGFRIQSENLRLDFSADALRSFFASFIKPATRKLLFDQEKI